MPLFVPRDYFCLPGSSPEAVFRAHSLCSIVSQFVARAKCYFSTYMA